MRVQVRRRPLASNTRRVWAQSDREGMIVWVQGHGDELITAEGARELGMWITANLDHWPPVAGKCEQKITRINVHSASSMPHNVKIWASPPRGSERNIYMDSALLTTSGAHELSEHFTANLPLWRSITESLRTPRQMHAG